MDKKVIIWSLRATKSFERIIDYLKHNWTDKEIEKFIKATNSVLQKLENNQVHFRSSGKRQVHEVLITKHNLLIYRIHKTEIQLLVFFDTRQHPKKKVV